MKITILAVGKLKEDYLKKAVAEYSKRLGKYCTLRIVEVDDEKTPAVCSERVKEQILEKEAQRLCRYMTEDMYVIALAIDGKSLSSEEMADELDRLQVRGHSHICFVIGGSLGLSRTVTDRGHLSLSFSPMTFPHQLVRIILLEQVYRCFRINYNEPYHK